MRSSSCLRIIAPLAGPTLFLSLLFWVHAPATSQEVGFPPAESGAEGLSPEALETLRNRVDAWVSEDRLVGAELLVIKNRRTLLNEAFGWKDREAGAGLTWP